MQAFYPYILIIHLSCAIFFIGFLFVDIFILKNIKKQNSNLNFEDHAIKIMPFVVLLLFMSGSLLSIFQNFNNLLFIMKLALVLCIFLLVAFSLSCRFGLKVKNPLEKFIHHLVFVISIFVVILAKLMLYFTISL